MNELKFDSINSIEVIILLLAIFTIIFIMIIEPRLNKRKLINKNEHGSSKFADIKEIKNTFQKEKISNSESVGFPVWYEKKNNTFETVYLDNKSPHFLLIGSTGSGKSVTVVIPECLMFATSKEKHSVVITDPKAEIFKATGKVFKDNGYDVVTVDFRNPSKSKRINIMQPIIDEWKEHCKYDKTMLFLLAHFIKLNKIKIDKLNDKKYRDKIKSTYEVEDYLIDIVINNKYEIKKYLHQKKMYEIKLELIKEDNLKEFLDKKTNDYILGLTREYQNKSSKHQAEASRLTISLADLIFTDKDTSDKFWINSAKQLFIGLVGIFLEDYQLGLIGEEKINIASIKKFQNSSLIKDNQTYLQKNVNSRKYGSLSKDYLISIISAAENTYKSVTAVFGEKMAIFDDLNVENITSTNEFCFTDLGRNPTALYIIVPDEDRAYFQLVTIIIGMLTKDLTKFANLPENGGVLPTRIEWILDEFANCPPLASIETLVSVARSRGMRFQFFIQSFSQLDQIYGKEVANIIQDNCALVYLKTNTIETAEVILKKLGKSTIETNSMSKSTDPTKIGANQTTSLMGKELLTATEIINLKYKTIIFPTVSNPIFRDTYLYSDLFPEYANVEVLERDTKILKRTIENYYTVEELREKYNTLNDDIVANSTKQIQANFQKAVNKTIKKISNEDKNSKLMGKSNIAAKMINDLLFNYKTDLQLLSENMYVINIKKIVPETLTKMIENYDKGSYSVAIAKNLKENVTDITIWND